MRDRSSGRLRQCALSRTPLPVEALVRFVLSPDGVVTPDTRCKLPGRGLWLRAQRQTIAEALRRKLFPRGFRSEAQASADLVETVERLLRQDALNALSLANKTGSVITGYEKIKDAIAKRRIEWLLHALDAAESGCNRLDRQFAPTMPVAKPGDLAQRAGALVLPRLFTAVELSLALGGRM